MFEGLGAQRSLALFAAGWLLFSFPLLTLWDVDATVFGLPLFPAGLFSVWALLIGALAWVAERGEAGDPDAAQRPAEGTPSIWDHSTSG